MKFPRKHLEAKSRCIIFVLRIGLPHTKPVLSRLLYDLIVLIKVDLRVSNEIPTKVENKTNSLKRSKNSNVMKQQVENKSLAKFLIEVVSVLSEYRKELKANENKLGAIALIWVVNVVVLAIEIALKAVTKDVIVKPNGKGIEIKKQREQVLRYKPLIKAWSEYMRVLNVVILEQNFDDRSIDPAFLFTPDVLRNTIEDKDIDYVKQHMDIPMLQANYILRKEEDCLFFHNVQFILGLVSNINFVRLMEASKCYEKAIKDEEIDVRKLSNYCLIGNTELSGLINFIASLVIDNREDYMGNHSFTSKVGLVHTLPKPFDDIDVTPSKLPDVCFDVITPIKTKDNMVRPFSLRTKQFFVQKQTSREEEIKDKVEDVLKRLLSL